MSQAQVKKKVADYLRNSQALEDHWQQPITAEQLQAEMDRMAQHTKQPEVLRELFGALGNDPFVIAECLARPVLTEPLVTDLSAHDKTGALILCESPKRKCRRSWRRLTQSPRRSKPAKALPLLGSASLC
jgi:hypothetical protein